VADIDKETFDLSVKNPNKKDETVLREPQEIITEMQKLDAEIKSSVMSIQKLL
jgi:type I restriction enzyme M protein